MFPMISGVEELLAAKEMLEESRQELREEGIPFDENCAVGAMIEIPSAAMIADQLAGEVDFFSIGTNDLIQYTIAVDRGNEKVAYLFEPLHPGVLRLIRRVVEAGEVSGIPVMVCGEMAGDPWFSALLLGLGVEGLSMSPMAIPAVKRAIRSITIQEAKSLAEDILDLRTQAEIRSYLENALPEEVRDSLSHGALEEVMIGGDESVARLDGGKNGGMGT
jgi:phosphotransferase system enzyme I (PtsI)